MTTTFENQIALGQAKKDFILNKGHFLFAIQLAGIEQEALTITGMGYLSQNPTNVPLLTQWEENLKARVNTIVAQVEEFSGEEFKS